MKKYLPILKRTKLFSGIDETELLALLNCLSAVKKDVPKGGYIYHVGEYLSTVALMLKGSAHIQRSDYWGNLSILGKITEGDIFGEAFALPGSETMLNDVLATEDSTILLLDVSRILTVCSSSCRFHNLLVKNLFSILAQKNRTLTRKLKHMSCRTTREKLLSYLSEQSRLCGSPSFEIPFNRQQLADFLSVDRSAMSNELSKMQSEGIIEFDRNKFILK